MATSEKAVPVKLSASSEAFGAEIGRKLEAAMERLKPAQPRESILITVAALRALKAVGPVVMTHKEKIAALDARVEAELVELRATVRAQEEKIASLQRQCDGNRRHVFNNGAAIQKLQEKIGGDQQ